MASKSKGTDEAQGLIHTIENSISNLTQLVEEVRTRIVAIKAEREQMESTRVSKAEAMQRMDSWLAKLQKRGAVALRNLTFRDDYPVELIARSMLDGDGYVVMTEAAAAMVYFFPDVIRAKLASEIDVIYGDVVAVDSTDYPRRLKEIDGRLFAAEMEEEKIIQRAEDSGLTIHRRPDANPRVLLEA